MKFLDIVGLDKYDDLLRTKIIAEMNDALEQALEDFAGALRFRALINTNTNFLTDTDPTTGKAYEDAKKGDVYIASAALRATFINTSGQTVSQNLEVGDAMVCLIAQTGSEDARWGTLNTNWTIETYSNPLQWNTQVRVATVGGVDINVTLPERPAYTASEIGAITNIVIGTGSSISKNGTVMTLPKYPTASSLGLGDAAYKGVISGGSSINGTSVNLPTGKAVHELVSVISDGLDDTNRAAAEALVQLAARLEAVEALQDTFGNATGASLDLENIPTVLGYPLFTVGSGAPTDFPRFIGQHYFDKTNLYEYIAVTLTGSSSDWVKRDSVLASTFSSYQSTTNQRLTAAEQSITQHGTSISRNTASITTLQSGLAVVQTQVGSAVSNAVFDAYKVTTNGRLTAVEGTVVTIQSALATKLTKNASITAGTATKISYDSKGLVTKGTALTANDIPDLPSTKITSLGTGLSTQDKIDFDSAFNVSGTGFAMPQSGIDSLDDFIFRIHRGLQLVCETKTQDTAITTAEIETMFNSKE